MRIVIDTDPGNGIPGADIDDGLAIGMALRSPEVRLEAITVVAGNVGVDRGVECALELLEAAEAPDVPVYQGADRPLVQDPAWWRARLDLRRDDELAQELWRDVRPRGSRRAPQATPAARALVELVDANPGEITVVAVGPLTNVARAMLLDPTWADKVAGLVVMGGAFDLPNILQELNAAYDPEATDIVLRSAAPLRLVPLDVTLQTFLRLADVDRLDASGTPLGSYLATTVRPWVTWLAQRYDRDGCPLHDPLALAALLDPSLVTTRTASVGIELRGALTRGRTVAWDPTDDELLHAGLELPDVRPVTIATGVDNDRFVTMLLERLCS
ncbi:nucleoside hydrolase [Georgenia wangjunii]|uniref:nucleoside hydrolase n=1 Tax=Georgenia wangjunii TaxID=3117730 RepID=UPI002F265EB1